MAQIHQLLPNRALGVIVFNNNSQVIIDQVSSRPVVLLLCDDNLGVVKHLAYIVARRSPPALHTHT